MSLHNYLTLCHFFFGSHNGNNFAYYFVVLSLWGTLHSVERSFCSSFVAASRKEERF